MAYIHNFRADSEKRLLQMQEMLVEAKGLIGTVACVYATGSFGRQEAGSASDLDLFILSNDAIEDNGKSESCLRHLDEICVKADLIKVTRKLGIRDFDGDGKYLELYTIGELIKTLGTPHDDVLNTFTARLLLLLESKPLLGADVYYQAIEEVVSAYWRDFEHHQFDFAPAYLTNDILRLWRTFCVNYEANTESQPEEKRVKRKIKNFTLKYSRQLTCFSGLLYLLFIFGREKTVRPEDARRMVELSPTRRIEAILEEDSASEAFEPLSKLIEMYDSFLFLKNDPSRLAAEFCDPSRAKERTAEARRFGELMFDAINKLGNGNKLHRLIVV